MDCPAALWLSRTDVSCDKRSCRCHPRRADTLHTLQWLPASPSPCRWPPPPPRTLFRMPPQLSQSESQMRVSVRVCLLQALIWCYYFVEAVAVGCGTQELLVDDTCLRYGPATPIRSLNRWRRWERIYCLHVSPPSTPEKQQSLCDFSTRPCFEITKTS